MCADRPDEKALQSDILPQDGDPEIIEDPAEHDKIWADAEIVKDADG